MNSSADSIPIKVGCLQVCGTNFDLFKGENTIGSDTSCRIVFKSKGVDKIHAVITIEDPSFPMLCDKGSKYKTKLGKTVLEPHRIYCFPENAKITFGNIKATYIKYTCDEDDDEEEEDECFFTPSQPLETVNNDPVANINADVTSINADTTISSDKWNLEESLIETTPQVNRNIESQSVVEESTINESVMEEVEVTPNKLHITEPVVIEESFETANATNNSDLFKSPMLSNITNENSKEIHPKSNSKLFDTYEDICNAETQNLDDTCEFIDKTATYVGVPLASSELSDSINEMEMNDTVPIILEQSLNDSLVDNTLNNMSKHEKDTVKEIANENEIGTCKSADIVSHKNTKKNNASGSEEQNDSQLSFHLFLENTQCLETSESSVNCNESLNDIKVNVSGTKSSCINENVKPVDVKNSNLQGMSKSSTFGTSSKNVTCTESVSVDITLTTAFQKTLCGISLNETNLKSLNMDETKTNIIKTGDQKNINIHSFLDDEDDTELCNISCLPQSMNTDVPTHSQEKTSNNKCPSSKTSVKGIYLERKTFNKNHLPLIKNPNTKIEQSDSETDEEIGLIIPKPNSLEVSNSLSKQSVTLNKISDDIKIDKEVIPLTADNVASSKLITDKLYCNVSENAILETVCSKPIKELSISDESESDEEVHLLPMPEKIMCETQACKQEPLVNFNKSKPEINNESKKLSQSVKSDDSETDEELQFQPTQNIAVVKANVFQKELSNDDNKLHTDITKKYIIKINESDDSESDEEIRLLPTQNMIKLPQNEFNKKYFDTDKLNISADNCNLKKAGNETKSAEDTHQCIRPKINIFKPKEQVLLNEGTINDKTPLDRTENDKMSTIDNMQSEINASDKDVHDSFTQKISFNVETNQQSVTITDKIHCETNDSDTDGTDMDEETHILPTQKINQALQKTCLRKPLQEDELLSSNEIIEVNKSIEKKKSDDEVCTELHILRTQKKQQFGNAECIKSNSSDNDEETHVVPTQRLNIYKQKVCRRIPLNDDGSQDEIAKQNETSITECSNIKKSNDIDTDEEINIVPTQRIVNLKQKMCERKHLDDELQGNAETDIGNQSAEDPKSDECGAEDLLLLTQKVTIVPLETCQRQPIDENCVFNTSLDNCANFEDNKTDKNVHLTNVKQQALPQNPNNNIEIQSHVEPELDNEIDEGNLLCTQKMVNVQLKTCRRLPVDETDLSKLGSYSKYEDSETDEDTHILPTQRISNVEQKVCQRKPLTVDEIESDAETDELNQTIENTDLDDIKNNMLPTQKVDIIKLKVCQRHPINEDLQQKTNNDEFIKLVNDETEDITGLLTQKVSTVEQKVCQRIPVDNNFSPSNKEIENTNTDKTEEGIPTNTISNCGLSKFDETCKLQTTVKINCNESSHETDSVNRKSDNDMAQKDIEIEKTVYQHINLETNENVETDTSVGKSKKKIKNTKSSDKLVVTDKTFLNCDPFPIQNHNFDKYSTEDIKDIHINPSESSSLAVVEFNAISDKQTNNTERKIIKSENSTDSYNLSPSIELPILDLKPDNSNDISQSSIHQFPENLETNEETSEVHHVITEDFILKEEPLCTPPVPIIITVETIKEGSFTPTSNEMTSQENKKLSDKATELCVSDSLEENNYSGSLNKNTKDQFFHISSNDTSADPSQSPYSRMVNYRKSFPLVDPDEEEHEKGLEDVNLHIENENPLLFISPSRLKRKRNPSQKLKDALSSVAASKSMEDPDKRILKRKKTENMNKTCLSDKKGNKKLTENKSVVEYNCEGNIETFANKTNCQKSTSQKLDRRIRRNEKQNFASISMVMDAQVNNRLTRSSDKTQFTSNPNSLCTLNSKSKSSSLKDNSSTRKRKCAVVEKEEPNISLKKKILEENVESLSRTFVNEDVDLPARRFSKRTKTNRITKEDPASDSAVSKIPELSDKLANSEKDRAPNCVLNDSETLKVDCSTHALENPVSSNKKVKLETKSRATRYSKKQESIVSTRGKLRCSRQPSEDETNVKAVETSLYIKSIYSTDEENSKLDINDCELNFIHLRQKANNEKLTSNDERSSKDRTTVSEPAKFTDNFKNNESQKKNRKQTSNIVDNIPATSGLEMDNTARKTTRSTRRGTRCNGQKVSAEFLSMTSVTENNIATMLKVTTNLRKGASLQNQSDDEKLNGKSSPVHSDVTASKNITHRRKKASGSQNNCGEKLVSDCLPVKLETKAESENISIIQTNKKNNIKKIIEQKSKENSLNCNDDALLPGKSNRKGTITPKRKLAECVNEISPTSRIRRKTLLQENVLFTGVYDEKYRNIIVKLGGKVIELPNQCTVLVTDKVRRTVKFLCALSMGKPIVSLQWITDSNKAGCFLDPWRYVLCDKEAEKKFSFKLLQSLKVAQQKPMLYGYSVFVTPSVKPPPDELKTIVYSSGGTFYSKEPKKWTQESVIVTCEEDKSSWSKIKKNNKIIPLVNAEAILTGILKQSFIIDDYLIST